MLSRLCADAEIFEATDYETASGYAAQGCSIIFLDIELEDGRNGIELANSMRKDHPDAALVFVTAHMRYCEQVFESAPDAMLIKPFAEESVKRALAIVERKHASDGCITFATGKNSAQTVRVSDISYIESSARKLTVYNKSCEPIGTFRDLKLSQLMKRLPDSFVCCHQSFIVNLSCVVSISRYIFTLSGGMELPISQSRFKEARQRYFEYVGDTL
ncbi:two component transcriptional regulator, LytTR family [Ruminococcus sp. YE71]|nr:two component transcriptional regulator, LytTR family [Ruminococcus sp. YE78]SFW44959.1 two component transcriptional regulator, LytTR family [Ruminococcus sp. YE71]